MQARQNLCQIIFFCLISNSIPHFQALDHHVISDEEIIEDAMFGGRFAAKHPNFRVTLYYHTPPVRRNKTILLKIC